MRDLSDIRKDIDRIDDELIELFKERMDCAREVGYYKKERGIPVLNTQRENEVLDDVQKKGGEYGSYARLLFSNIMELSRALQHNIVGSGRELREEIVNAPERPESGFTVAYQGIKGANSHEAALRLFPDAPMQNFNTFAEVFEAAAVYDLILQYRFYIVGALDLPIDYCLAGLRQSELSDIEQVWSHPQALSQCADYNFRHGFAPIPCANTAVAARDTAREKRLNVAAICPYQAAEEYGLKVLDDHLQDNPYNATRFIVISKQLYISNDANKISLCFSLPHVTGSLYGLLCRFNSLGLNLTKIESRPMAAKDFDYLFYLDFSGNAHSDSVVDLLSQLSEEMDEFSFLGNYSETEAEFRV